MKQIFITGIPTSGKSYLAQLLAKKVGGIAVSLDDQREKIAVDPRYEKWVNFYLNQDEEEYLTRKTPNEQWQHLVAQSEGLWPALLEEIQKYKNEERPVIFECVNILPRLAKRDLPFPGIVLIGDSFEDVLSRNIKHPRWGSTLALQTLEAQTFFTVERPRYQAEAEKFGYPFYLTADAAIEDALKLLNR